MIKTFFTQKKAAAFAEALKTQGRAATIWTGKDGFGQTVYIVKWD